MTHYCGCCDDFQELYDRQERKLLAKRARDIGDKTALSFACDGMKKWMP